MRVGILGTGDVGQALGDGFVALGHDVRLGGREAGNAKALAWAKKTGGKGTAATFTTAAQFGEVVVLATLGLATPDVLKRIGPEAFKGKLVLDATNPLDFSKGTPPKLVGGLGDSGAERHQRLVPGAYVVKVFNTVGHALMFQPSLPGGPPDMFVCGDDPAAKERAAGIARDFGWNVVDVGDLSSAHYLEAMCMVWVLSASRTNRWAQAFKLLG